MDEKITIVREIDFEEIKRQTLMGHAAESTDSETTQEKSIEKIQEKTVEINRDLMEEGKEAMEEVRDKMEDIQQTSIVIRLEEDQGAVRAHFIHRITHRVLATIPWVFRNGQSAGARQTQMNEYMSSFYTSQSKGALLDTEI